MTPPLSRLEDFAALREDFSPEAWEALRGAVSMPAASGSAISRPRTTSPTCAPPSRARSTRRCRRAATTTEPADCDGEPGDIVTLDIHSLTAVARMVLGVGRDAVVLDPPELRELVISSLDRLMGVSV